MGFRSGSVSRETAAATDPTGLLVDQEGGGVPATAGRTVSSSASNRWPPNSPPSIVRSAVRCRRGPRILRRGYRAPVRRKGTSRLRREVVVIRESRSSPDRLRKLGARRKTYCFCPTFGCPGVPSLDASVLFPLENSGLVVFATKDCALGAGLGRSSPGRPRSEGCTKGEMVGGEGLEPPAFCV